MINLSGLGILALLHYPLIIFTALSLNIYSAYSLVAAVQQRPPWRVCKRSATQQKHHFTPAGTPQIFGTSWKSQVNRFTDLWAQLWNTGNYCVNYHVNSISISSSIPRYLIHGYFLAQGALWDRCNTKLFVWACGCLHDWEALSSICKCIGIRSRRFPTWVNYREGDGLSQQGLQAC